MNTFRWKIALFIFIWMLSFSCVGQVKESSNENIVSDQIYQNIKDSQIAEYIVQIYEDKHGNLWFGTMSKGTARFDGKSLEYFTEEDGLCGNTVLSITEDNQGDIWFGTHTGASKYDGESFTNFGVAEGLTGPGCNLLFDESGNLWAGTNHGVFRFENGVFIPFKMPHPVKENLSYTWEAGKVWDLIEDSHGNIWFGLDGYGLCQYDGESFTYYTKDDGLKSNNVSTVMEDKSGNFWIGSIKTDFPEYVREGGLNRYDGNDLTEFSSYQGLGNNDIYTIYQDSKSAVWISAPGVGVYRYLNNDFVLYNKIDTDLIKQFGLQSILEDSKGRIWFGFSGGLFRLEGETFQNITKDGPWE